MIVSLCTVVCNRLWQLEETLKHNKDFLKVDEVELCIAAYNDDTIVPFLKENYSSYLADGRIVVEEFVDNYKPRDGSSFACGHAKNLSHRLGKGKVLFNLDADNFMDETTLKQLYALKPRQILFNSPRDNLGDGRAGRIGCPRSLYYSLCGYRDVGRNDDGDFILRAILQGSKGIHSVCVLKPLPNQR